MSIYNIKWQKLSYLKEYLNSINEKEDEDNKQQNCIASIKHVDVEVLKRSNELNVTADKTHGNKI